MNKNVDKNKEEPQILLERYSRCDIPTGEIHKSFFESKKIDIEKMITALRQGTDINDFKNICNSAIQSKQVELENLKKFYESMDESQRNYCKSLYQNILSNKEFTFEQWKSEYNSLLQAEQKNGVTKYQANRMNITSMSVFCFIQSPEFGDNKWHLNFVKSGWISNPFGKDQNIEYVSYFDEVGNRKLYRTSEMMFLVNNQALANMFVDKTMDSEVQIKLLKAAGFKEFTVQLDDQLDKDDDVSIAESFPSLEGNKLKIVDEKGNGVSSVNEKYQKLDRNFYRKLNKNSDCEYINLAHIADIDRCDCDNKDTIDSVIVLSKNAKMYNCIEESYAYQYDVFYGTKNPLTFYLEPGAKVAIDILSKFRDEEKYPEFYNATIVFMSPKLVAEYQKNLDDVDNYREMKEFIKSYEANKDYFSFKLSDCSNQRIEQLSRAQTGFSDTWSDFVRFMKAIGFKEKSNVEQNNEKKENENETGKLDDKNQIESKFEKENVEKEITQNVEIETGENKDHNTGDPEDHLNVFMRYLKNHWPRIFKFLNAVCNFFSGFKSKFNSNDKNSLGNTGVGNINLKQSLIGQTLDSSSQKIVNRPNNMENQSVINQENSMQQEK